MKFFCVVLVFFFHFVNSLDTFSLPEVKYADLVTLEERPIQQIVQHLQEIGAIQISGIPRFGMARQRALEDLGECFVTENAPVSVEMQDGSHRVSTGAISTHGIAEEMSHICGEAASKLRAAVDATSHLLFIALDSVASKKNTQHIPLMEPSYNSFKDLMSKGDHIEHLHAYFAPSKLTTDHNPATLGYHVDAGLMIAMTTGYYTNAPASDISGLYLQLEDGKKVKAIADDDSLIVLMGDGASRWLNPVLGKPFRAVQHALIADLPVGSQATRSWYGKMYLPPADAVIPQEQLTFEKYHALESKYTLQLTKLNDISEQDHLHTILPSACGGNINRFMTITVGNCASNQIWCWMSCMNVPDNCSAEDAVCVDTIDGTVNNGDIHCMNDDGTIYCEPECLDQPSNNSTNDQYCIGQGTSMFMSGFASIAEKGEGKIECVNLFFTEWTLNSRVKYAFGCLGIFLMGILIQYLAKVRNSVSQIHNDIQRKALLTILYGVHVTLGYFAMLAAMTYSAELFCMICCGLTVGFAIFHLDKPNLSKSTDPCCPDTIDDDFPYRSINIGDKSSTNKSML